MIMVSNLTCFTKLTFFFYTYYNPHTHTHIYHTHIHRVVFVRIALFCIFRIFHHKEIDQLRKKCFSNISLYVNIALFLLNKKVKNFWKFEFICELMSSSFSIGPFLSLLHITFSFIFRKYLT